eukprot:1161659-Pelagomonas_calceolata.AAC.5
MSVTPPTMTIMNRKISGCMMMNTHASPRRATLEEESDLPSFRKNWVWSAVRSASASVPMPEKTVYMALLGVMNSLKSAPKTTCRALPIMAASYEHEVRAVTR